MAEIDPGFQFVGPEGETESGMKNTEPEGGIGGQERTSDPKDGLLLRLELPSSIATPKTIPEHNPAVRLAGIVAFSRIEPASDGPVSRGPDYPRNRIVASAKQGASARATPGSMMADITGMTAPP